MRRLESGFDELVIEADRAERQYWYDLWRYRELFHILAWRDLAVRYKQTVIGVAWALIRPVADDGGFYGGFWEDRQVSV